MRSITFWVVPRTAIDRKSRLTLLSDGMDFR
ncbi:hypothetical protein J2S54_006191 [Streptomyces sp. DSM 42143]|nr:hypothetical protein [Streptomyces sp. DSM 42143]